MRQRSSAAPVLCAGVNRLHVDKVSTEDTVAGAALTTGGDDWWQCDIDGCVRDGGWWPASAASRCLKGADRNEGVKDVIRAELGACAKKGLLYRIPNHSRI